MMKRTFTIVGVAALLLIGCGGVDKDGTADNLIKELEKLGQTFTADQKDCIKNAVKSYDDDELRKLSENKASDELNADFATKLTGCLT
jgi:uncharacterized protein YcfL